MKIVITGAGGFLGSELLKQLSKIDDIIIYAFTFDFERERENFIKSENIFVVDNSEAKFFDYSNIDALVNCAFPRNVDDSSFADGLDFIQSIFMKASSDGVESVINISSQSVYSQKRSKPADEFSEIILESKYAVGKYCVELLVNSLFKDIRHTNIRMASLIGVGFNQRIVNKFVAKVVAGDQISISGGEQQFGYMDVRDAASGIIKVILNKDSEWDDAYNLGTNESYSLLEIAKSACNEGIKRGYDKTKIVLNENDTWQNSSVVCDKFYKEFSWQPIYKLEDTIFDIFNDFE